MILNSFVQSNILENTSFIRRITMTPSGVIYNLKEPEMNNRLIRQNTKYIDYFIRATFLDDNMSKPKNIYYISTQLFRN